MADPNPRTTVVGVDTTIHPHNPAPPSGLSETSSPILVAVELLVVVKPSALDENTAADVVKSALLDASAPAHIAVVPCGISHEQNDHVKVRSSHSLAEMFEVMEKLRENPNLTVTWSPSSTNDKSRTLTVYLKKVGKDGQDSEK
jgi:hypothetical protein